MLLYHASVVRKTESGCGVQEECTHGCVAADTIVATSMGSQSGFSANLAQPRPPGADARYEAESGGAATDGGGGNAQRPKPGTWGSAAPLTVRAADGGGGFAEGGRMPPLIQATRRYQSLSITPPQVRVVHHLSHRLRASPAL